MLTLELSVPVWDRTPVEVLAAQKLRVGSVRECTILKKSVDARKKDAIRYLYRVAVRVPDEEKYIRKDVRMYDEKICTLENTMTGKNPPARPVVVGAGPAGLFCALALCYAGARPVVLERGESVDDRIGTVDAFNRTRAFQKDSNVLFGEGGAGTFSDGKLNTNLRGELVEAVLREFVRHGAPEEILYLAKPHIGTDKLVGVVKNMRRAIESRGGRVLFSTQMTDLTTRGDRVVGVRTTKGDVACDALYLAIGHSARDTIEMLVSKGIKTEPKIFSMGARIEHLRKDIDEAQYGKCARFLPAADYKTAVELSSGRSLYTFCMCPGGVVVNASGEEGGVNVNGMSYHARDGVNSNAALLVNVTPEDWIRDGILGGIELQRKCERLAFRMSGDYRPVVQTVGDLLKNASGTPPTVVTPSVETGYVLGDLRGVLPDYVAEGLREGLPLLGRRIRGLDADAAVLTGPEVRSSSPVRIVREYDFSSSLAGLYPIGEGAGYAGGITSAAMDGIKAALATCR